MKTTNKYFLMIIVILLCLASVGMPILAAAFDWVTEDVTYVVNDKMPASVTGSYSRVFLPEVTAVLSNGTTMDVNYKVKKDGKTVGEGKYEYGAYFDLVGAGHYEFIYDGDYAMGTYSFSVEGRDDVPSVVLEKKLDFITYKNEYYSFPKGLLMLGGQSAEATVTVEMANKHLYQPSDKMLPESGLMYVTYAAEIGGKLYQVTYEVDVYDMGIGFYGADGNRYLPGDVSEGVIDLTGCILDSKSTLRYTYSEILDLSACTKDHPLLVLNNASTSPEKDDRVLPHFKLVDAHDPTNYIEVGSRWNTLSVEEVYTVARTPGQTYLGHVSNAPYTGKELGTTTTFKWNGSSVKGTPAAYYYDAEEKALYVDYNGTKSLVSDFDAEYQVNPWKGFTTGEVYLVIERITESDYICVESVGGLKLDGYRGDSFGPTLYINADEDNTYAALVGVEYSVFSAHAVDLYDSNVPVSLRVYKGYDATSGIELNVVDGKFLPYDAGYYTLVYEAQDRFANKTVQRFTILAGNDGELPPISAVITDVPKTASVGDKLSLFAPESISGGVGEVTYVIKHIAPDGTVKQVTDNVVVLNQSGTNTIVYEFTDTLGRSNSISFDISTKSGGEPVVYPVSVPNYLRSGKHYVIPELSYYSQGNATVEITATLNGKPLEIVNNTILPINQSGSEELKLIYSVTNASGTTEKVYTILVLDGDVADRSTFFYNTLGAFQIQQQAENMYLSTSQSNSSVMFLNPILASKLDILLQLDSRKNDADSFAITLTDTMDPSVSVRLDVVKSGSVAGYSDFYINGTRSGSIAGDFFGRTKDLRLSYSAKNSSLFDANGNLLGKLTETLEGSTFNGFPSGEVYITFSAGNVGANGFGFSLKQLNNQTFFDNKLFFDAQAEVALNGELDMQKEIGDKIIIPTAIAGDVLSAECTVTVTVRLGNSVILDKQPANVPYEVTLDDFGTYQIMYQYYDGVKTKSLTYRVTTIEREPPQVTLPVLPTEAKIGTTVKLALPTATDNHSENVTISVIVREPNNKMILVNKEELSFKAEMTGTYTVMFYVYDECFNYQIVTHTVSVTK